MSSTFQCSPHLKRRDGDTCLPKSALERLRKAWNRTHPTKKIPAPGTRKRGQTRDSKLELWKKLREAMRTHYKCETEFCLVKKLPGVSEMEKSAFFSYFRPEKPIEWDKKPTQWLDSYNIEDVMNQYEKAEPNFEFIGPVPIDFDSTIGWGKCVVDELCNLRLDDMLKKGKEKLGIIYNLDKHDEPGSHWVCSFVNIPKREAYYFDSYGYESPEEIARFLERCRDQGCTNVYYNDIRHQRKGSECGMYCLFVLICLLRDRPFYDICKQVVDDDTINAFRDILYAEEKPRREAIENAMPRLCL